MTEVRSRTDAVPTVVVAVVVALALGALTSSAQGWLPEQVASLANSAAPWCAVAFLLALPARSARSAAAIGALVLGALVAGYYLTSDLRGFGVSTRAVAFWVAAAVVAGPVLGLAAHLVRRGEGLLAGAACGVPAGLLVGESLYGMLFVAATTSPTYWVVEVVAGVVLLVVLAAARLRRRTEVAAAVLTAALVAGVVLGLLAGDLLSLL